jgi:hypothetical protein
VTASFLQVANRFAAQVDAVGQWTGDFTRPDWAARNAELARDLLPVPPEDFLLHPAIRYQMLVDERVMPHELPYVRSRLPDDHLLKDDPVGRPPTVPLDDEGNVVSPNTVHQLFHLLRYEESTGRRVSDAHTIVEWGGGFGSLMRLVCRMHVAEPTCVVVDTPIFSALQWLYLSAVLGEDRVVLHSSAPVNLAHGHVNLVPVGLIDRTDVTPDLFISNWALNECLPAAQRYVAHRGWLAAESLLLAMHAGDPLAGTLYPTVRAVMLGDFMSGQHYLVR